MFFQMAPQNFMLVERKDWLRNAHSLQPPPPPVANNSGENGKCHDKERNIIATYGSTLHRFHFPWNGQIFNFQAIQFHSTLFYFIPFYSIIFYSISFQPLGTGHKVITRGGGG
jgi:hypothetical protein